MLAVCESFVALLSESTRMSEKPEPRLHVELPIRVFGMGADGRPFLNHAQARNISHHGAKLSGLETHLKAGDVIAVQVGDTKARCKVVWVVDAGQAQRIEIGVNLIEGQPCPWEKELQQTGQARNQLLTSRRPTKISASFRGTGFPFQLKCATRTVWVRT